MFKKLFLVLSFLLAAYEPFCNAITVEMPNAHILMRKFGDWGLDHFIEKTNVIEELANRSLTPKEIYKIRFKALKAYMPHTPDRITAAAVIMNVREAFKSFFNEFPEAKHEYDLLAKRGGVLNEL